MIHFKFTRKNVRRLCVTMALIAPIIYLFGTLFTYLNGAHGDIVLAQPVYVEDYVEVSNPVDGYSYRFEPSNVTPVFNTLSDVSFTSTLVCNGVSYSRWGINRSISSNAVQLRGINDTVVIFVQCPFGVTDLPLSGLSFDLTSDQIYYFNSWFVGTWFQLTEVPSEYVPENNSANTEFLFSQFFARDNFVAKIGEDAISETPHGFAPFGSLFRYIDQNALHMADTQVGLMAYGYLYWCAHVLLFDVLFMMTTFFISFIERVGDRLGGNE